ncbi:fungal-specific transcription factor domain-containing protein [Stachybotrys elegans]|uniref:Fungal-specific transcription factor domain-containing protein n=1 Tax=Stachybotrys elegans TaxID=80388 RepID=A0A8K0WMW0_9HYPO|nr:fungal-specific transcription factor domain-containing protein [Stachybotrys elegans]
MDPDPPQKRRRIGNIDSEVSAGEAAKGRKVSRACDFCKSRKSKCSGTQPCDKCLAKGRHCLYDAKYTRGRPPTPPMRPEAGDAEESAVPSRASPEIGMAEIQGQVFDSTSGLSFLHRAWKRLSAQHTSIGNEEVGASETQPVTMAGDNPLSTETHEPLRLPDPTEARRLLALYFDVCIATYRFLHRPTVEAWLDVLERNMETEQPIWRGIGHARAAIVLVVLAIAVAHREKSNNFTSVGGEANALKLSDELFSIAARLTDGETGFPRLESAQARLVQVLYLLTTSRFNRSWFVFGIALQFVSALGLHRRANFKRRRIARTVDYIHVQCGLRTFWTAYILDNHLGVIFGRPRHFHDQDIDQELPERVNDDNMTADGPINTPGNPDCHIDALIFHTRIARIIGKISREIYSTRTLSEEERVAAAHRLMHEVHEWHADLPLHLGSIPPSMLIPSYRRQATVLKLAHAHAIMHSKRLFLLGNSASLQKDQVDDCLAAARVVLETVDASAAEGPIFHAFWWTHYVTFTALVIVYVWEIQQRRQGWTIANEAELLRLANRCHTHLAQATATNSPSRRYAVILEEFREAALTNNQIVEQVNLGLPVEVNVDPLLAGSSQNPGPAAMQGLTFFDEWEMTDWLDLDSSAFWPHADISESLEWPSYIYG